MIGRTDLAAQAEDKGGSEGDRLDLRELILAQSVLCSHFERQRLRQWLPHGLCAGSAVRELDEYEREYLVEGRHARVDEAVVAAVRVRLARGVGPRDLRHVALEVYVVFNRRLAREWHRYQRRPLRVQEPYWIPAVHQTLYLLS